MAYLRTWFSDRHNRIFFACIACALFLISCINLFVKDCDTDVLWHYKLGEQIAETGRITLENTFTWQKGTTWNQQEWLFDVLFYLVVHSAGLPGFWLMNTLMLVCGALLGLSIAKPEFSQIFLIFYCLVKVSCSQCGRPGEYSVFLIMLWFALYDRLSGGWKYGKVLIASAALGILMANFHGGNILFMIVAWLVLLAGDIVLDLCEKRRPWREWLRKALVLLPFGAAACLCPSGYHILTNTFTASQAETIDRIAEWQPLQMNLVSAVILLLMLFSLGYSLKLHRRDAVFFRHFLITAACAVLALISVRCTLIFLNAWLFFCFPYFYEIVYDFTGAKKGEEVRISDLFGGKVLPEYIIALAFCAVVVIAGIQGVLVRGYRTFDDYADRLASKTILNRIVEGAEDDTRVLTAYTLNNVLLYHDVKVSVDTREYPYDTETNHTLLEQFNMSYSETVNGCNELINRYRFDYVWTDETLFRVEVALEKNPHYRKVCHDADKNQTLWVRVEEDTM